MTWQEKRFSARHRVPLIVSVYSWLRELGLDLPFTTDVNPETLRLKIMLALQDQNWDCVSWEDPVLGDYVVRARQRTFSSVE
jgi:hypothetical protein